MDDIITRFGQRLKSLRKKNGFSIPELSIKSGVSRQHIRELELPDNKKRVTIVTLEMLAAGLGLSLSQFLKAL